MPRENRPTDQANDGPQQKRQVRKPNGAATEDAQESRVDIDNDQVARRAYEIYQSRGAAHGSDLDHWLEAERQLKPGPTSVTGSVNAKPKKGKKTPEAGV